ncbi:MAG: efflux transporter periplasmic adaptor subunit [Gammaproteobacteria bacterium]|nr:MAG: efflux transporter periplasmic adaptor subunit [Gammaproteobacteria bacterium]
MRAYFIAILLLLLIFGTVGGLFYRNIQAMSGNGGPPPPTVIEIGEVSTASLPNQLQAVGSLRARQGAALTAEESGTITRIDFKAGDTVQRGALLLTLNDNTEQAALAQQRANVKLSRLQFDRDARLLEKRSISQTQFDQSQAALDAAIAREQQAEAALEKKRVRAPFSGTIGITNLKVGDYLNTGAEIAKLEDTRTLEALFTVPARYYPKLALGQRVAVRVEASDETFYGHITAIDNGADAATGGLALRAELKGNKVLLPGMFANLTIDLGEAIERLVVPETAITYSLHGNTAWVISQNDEGHLIAKPQIVKTGLSRDGHTIVMQGLQAGQEIAIAGQNKLYPGVLVSGASKATPDETDQGAATAEKATP